jgi:hypothetical protein
MTVLTIADTASFDSRSTANAGYISGLFAGEALDALAACRIHTDGKVYMASTSYKTSGSASDYAGFVAKDVPVNSPVTLFRDSAIASYSADMTPGKYLFISGSATKGQLSDSVVLANDEPCALAISSTDIVVIK